VRRGLHRWPRREARDRTSPDLSGKAQEWGNKRNVASAGQQATALLQVLLNQGGPPLVVDQPEDDLDSQKISDVVDRTWDARHRRQLIFSSHNANL